MSIWIYKREDPTASYKWAGWVWEISCSSSRLKALNWWWKFVKNQHVPNGWTWKHITRILTDVCPKSPGPLMWMCFPSFCRFEHLWKVNFFPWERTQNVLGCPAHQSVSSLLEEVLLISISSIWWPPYLVAMSIQRSAQVPIQRNSGISTVDAHEIGRRR